MSAGSQRSAISRQLDAGLVRELVAAALSEDRAEDDITTKALIPADQRGRASLVAKAEGVVAGLPVAEVVFATLDSELAWSTQKADGDLISAGESIASIEGHLASILRGERVALNFLAHLSGVASMTATVVAFLEGTDCRLRDTRKTTPGLRALEKYAVRMGGGANHRMDLSDAVLIKDNHLAALRSRLPARADYIGEAVRLARGANPGAPIEIEVTSVGEARRALDSGAEELLLDNMSLDAMRQVVAFAAGREARPGLEASGGITLESARAVAETGVDFISMGAITHSAPALDMSLEVQA